MDKIPFSLYDILGYLAAGAIVLGSWALVFMPMNVWSYEPSVLSSMMILLLAYVTGHVVASIAESLFHWLICERILDPPEKWLLELPVDQSASEFKEPCKPFNKLSYFRSIRQPHLDRLKTKINTAIGTEVRFSKSAYVHCYNVIIERESARSRLGVFLALYGFCRNSALALLLSCLFMIIGARTSDLQLPGPFNYFGAAVLASFGAAVLFLRYLKFYRHYTKQVFELYLEGSL